MNRKPLSAEEQAKRAPLPPEMLVDALQDSVHRDPGRARAAKSVKVRPSGWPLTSQHADRERRLTALGFEPVSDAQRARNLEDNLDSLVDTVQP